MRLAAIAAFALVFAGCTGQSTQTSDPGPLDGAAPTGTGAGPGTHGAPTRVEGETTVRMQGSDFVAQRTVDLSNDFGGAGSAVLGISTLNGGVEVRQGPAGGYAFKVQIHARAPTEQQARDLVAATNVVLEDTLGSSLRLELAVEFNAPPVGPVDGIPLDVGSRGASVEAVMPAAPSFDLDAASSNGQVDVTGLHGTKVRLGSSNGAMEVSGAWDVVDLQTSNGAITLGGTANELDVSTSNAGIDADLRSTRSARQDFATSNGDITIRHEGAGIGFDVTASTSNGEASVTLPDAHDEGDATAHARSADFTQQSIQVTIEADSSNSDVRVTAG